MEYIFVLLTIVILILLYILFLHRYWMGEFQKQLEYNRIHNSSALIRMKRNNISLNYLVNELNLTINRIDEVKKQNQALLQQQRQMISAISHDFRTPLTSILGYIELLKKCDDPLIRDKYIDIVLRRSESLKDLIEYFYRMSIIDSSDLVFECESVNVVALVQEQLALYYQDLTSKFDNISIQVDEMDFRFESDVQSLQRIISNLIKNVLVHGQAFFKVDGYCQEDVYYVVFSNDANLPNGFDVNRLFERNYKVDKTRSNLSSGLGLSIVKELCIRLDIGLIASLTDNVIEFKLIFDKNRILNKKTLS